MRIFCAKSKLQAGRSSRVFLSHSLVARSVNLCLIEGKKCIQSTVYVLLPERLSQSFFDDGSNDTEWMFWENDMIFVR